MAFQLEQNGPIVANRMRAAVASAKAIGAFSAVSCAYAGTDRVFPHRAPLAAFRTLASICNHIKGKLHKRGEFAAAIVTPCGRVLTWREARTAFRTIR